MAASLSVKALWSASAIRAPLTGASALSSHRLFHTSRAEFTDSKESTDATTVAAAEGEAEAETTAPIEEKLPFRRRNFNKWLRTEGARFATPSFSGPNYIGETVRFLFWNNILSRDLCYDLERYLNATGQENRKTHCMLIQ